MAGRLGPDSEAQYQRAYRTSSTFKPRRLHRPRARRARLQLLHGPSLGNPVLKDWHLRQALQWAVDHNKLVQIAYGGLAQPATSVLVSHLVEQPGLALAAAPPTRCTRSI